ncbi:TerY-C metal binding domain-containing protein [Pseudomonas sputi]|uniref:TerY-C metal binding domain-containing protein n=1 Tax=Pseudomonas sputi TaxID=2892325 RepID=UPI001F3953CF|nr:TerY-C metal binding domain-containing protein [Pseudomonas sputi]
MEMIKQQDKPLSLLEKARQELAAFNRKGVAVPQATSTHAGVTTSEPSHGDRILYCSKVPQASAVLVLKLHEKGAEITDVIARRKAVAPGQGGAQAVRNDLVLRALLCSNYQGCPHCDNTSLVLCSDCGNLSCVADEADSLFCPVCSHTGRIVRTGIKLEFSQSRNGHQGQSQSGQKMLAKPTGRPALLSKPK